MGLTSTFGIILIKVHSEIMRNLQHIDSTFSPIYRLTDAFAFHLDQTQAVPSFKIKLEKILNYTRAQAPTVTSQTGQSLKLPMSYLEIRRYERPKTKCWEHFITGKTQKKGQTKSCNIYDAR